MEKCGVGGGVRKNPSFWVRDRVMLSINPDGPTENDAWKFQRQWVMIYMAHTSAAEIVDKEGKEGSPGGRWMCEPGTQRNKA